MVVTFYKEWTNEYGHKFKVGETVELWNAHHALRAGVCVLEGQPIPKEEIAVIVPVLPEDTPHEETTKKKRGNK